MRLTLLEIVQSVMNDMGGDEISSISDTVESLQVASIVRDTYAAMMANRNWPHMKKLFQLTESTISSSSSVSFPTTLTLPTEIKELEWFRYNKRRSADTKDKYEIVQYKNPDEFYDYCASRASSATNVQRVIINGVTLNIRKDQPPQFWTSFNDGDIVCDSWDQSVGIQLATSKNTCYGVRNPTWVHDDTAVPELPTEAFPSLLEEARATCFFVLRETVNQKAEQISQRQSRWLSRKAWRAKGGVKYASYGRKSTGSARNPQFNKD